MPLRQTDDQSHIDNTAPNNLCAIASNKCRYTVLLCEHVSTELTRKLAKHFNLIENTNNMDMDTIDAVFMDCRGTEIRRPHAECVNNQKLTLALIDEHSYLQHDHAETTSPTELLTEAELGSRIPALRIDAHNTRTANSTNHTETSSNFVEEHAFEILKTFVQNSTDWMVLKDLDNRFIIASDRFLKSHGKTHEEVVGKTDLEIGTPEEEVFGGASNNGVGFWRLDQEAIKNKETTFVEQLIVHENSLEQTHERVARVPVKDSAGNVIALFVCITELYNSKIGGQSMSSRVSRRNILSSPILKTLDSERSKTIAINQKTESAIRRRNNFFATASHDLRQPLHAIGLFIESLQNQIVDKNQQATLAKMKQSSTDLNELLNSILDISKLDADAVLASKTHFCLAPLLTSIEDEFETDAKHKSLNLHIANTNSVVHTDSLLLLRIIRNLVSNSVKYTKTGGVSLQTEVNTDSLLIHINDTGPGIPEEQYQSIFAQFHQVDGQDAEPNFGMGLGLSIVKRLTDLLNIEIKLESVPDVGTHISLRVPLGDASNKQTTLSKQKPLDAFEPYKLLIVEDNPVVLDAMQIMLTGMNCDAYPASDIPEALEIIRELDDLPDLLIIDYQLANGVTGDTAIEKICEAANELLPAIIVTGNTNNALYRRASESAYRVLNKPVNPDALLKTIASAVKEHREIEA